MMKVLAGAAAVGMVAGLTVLAPSTPRKADAVAETAATVPPSIWYLIGISELRPKSSMLFIDKASLIPTTNGKLLAWLVKYTPVHSDRSDIQQMLAQYDCKQQTITYLAFVEYNSEGRQVERVDVRPEDQKSTTLTPESIGGLGLKFVCGQSVDARLVGAAPDMWQYGVRFNTDKAFAYTVADFDLKSDKPTVHSGRAPSGDGSAEPSKP